MSPDVVVISDAHYDAKNKRVVITIEPCLGAEKLSVTRCNNLQLLYGEWILKFVDATGDEQVFYDNAPPLNTKVRYRVLSYAERVDGMLLASKNYSAEVVVDTTDHQHWLKGLGR